MYIALLLIILAIGFAALRRRSIGRRVAGVVVIVGGLAFFGLMSFWGEKLWFQQLGFGDRFWTFVVWRVGVPLFGAALGWAMAFVLTARSGPHLRRSVTALAVAAGTVWGLKYWRVALLYVHGVSTGVADPLLGVDTGFYLFALPFYDGLFWLLLFVALSALLAALFVWEQGGVIRPRHLREAQGDPWVLPLANAGFALVIAAGIVLRIFHLLYSNWGVVLGPGWVDQHVRLPAMIAAAAGLVLVALLPLWPASRTRLYRWLGQRFLVGRPAVAAMAVAWSVMGMVGATVLLAIPGLVQWLVVKPNEITFEKPYIANNIAFTRRGFKLDRIEEREFTPSGALTEKTFQDNRQLLEEVRLWDWRALDAVYKQFQEIRLYYEFVDVDIDRYNIGNRYRQVMVSARELSQRNLAPQSQTFVNKRFKYTHGYGYTMAAVSDFTPEGLPNLLVQDIPPQTAWPNLAVKRPQIYYGELTTGPVIVNTREPEFDYPSGESNEYTRYAGQGGVPLSSFWRKWLYGWKFDGSVLLFSSYPTRDSRIMFHRQIRSRVHTLAPFLELDDDPYIAAVDGRLYWIVDAYTGSTYYPYSQPFESRESIESREGRVGASTVSHLRGANYVRNSVKAVVDAYTGQVDFYVFDVEDPIIRSWQRALPGMFKPESAVPADLRAHVRYPTDFLLMQGLTYAKYHMSDPAVFYNQEDLWVRGTEKHYSSIAPVDPYYVMWQQPGSDHAELVLMLPFTPKNRQVLIGWIAGMCDGDNYGRFLAYKFPKEKRVLGPQQVETKIDQDSFLSGQLTLWDQQGSQVIRGNVLAIPMDKLLLYVEPIYLQAETAAYPELRLVAVMHGDTLSYADTFDKALLGLLEKERAEEPMKVGLPASMQELAAQAKAAFDGYLKSLGAGEFEKAASQLSVLRKALDAMAESAKAP
jgi:uncharacterized membrane protein (UPF0182 family)